MVSLEQLSAGFIACLEGLRLQAYRDSGGIWTIGVGHTGPNVGMGLTITYEQAMVLFSEDQAPLLKMVAGRPLLEAVALVDFGFNVGRGALANVLAGKDSIDNPAHTKDRHGNVLPGLVARRKLEALLIQASQ